MKKTKGFTLIELLLTLMILALIVGIASLNFDFLNNYQENLEIRSVVNAFNEARNNAISSGNTTRVEFKGRENFIRLYDQDNKVIETVNLKSLSIAGLDKVFKFNPTGAPSVAGTYVFNGKKKKYIVTVEVATGKVNLDEKEI